MPTPVAIEFKVNDQQLRDVSRRLEGIKNGMPRAVSGAINDVTKKGKTRIERGITSRYYIKKKDLKPFVTIRRATVKRLSAQIGIKGKRIPLMDFRVTPKQPFRAGEQTKTGRFKKIKPVRATIKKADTKRKYEGAFIARMPSGHVGVFKRRGRGNVRRVRRVRFGSDPYYSELPIDELHGPSVPAIFQNEDNRIQAEALTGMRDELAKRIDARADLIIRRKAGGR